MVRPRFHHQMYASDATEIMARAYDWIRDEGIAMIPADIVFFLIEVDQPTQEVLRKWGVDEVYVDRQFKEMPAREKRQGHGYETDQVLQIMQIAETGDPRTHLVGAGDLLRGLIKVAPEALELFGIKPRLIQKERTKILESRSKANL